MEFKPFVLFTTWLDHGSEPLERIMCTNAPYGHIASNEILPFHSSGGRLDTASHGSSLGLPACTILQCPAILRALVPGGALLLHFKASQYYDRLFPPFSSQFTISPLGMRKYPCSRCARRVSQRNQIITDKDRTWYATVRSPS